MRHYANNFDEHDDDRPDTVPVNDLLIVLVAIFSLLAAGAAAGVLRTAAVARTGASSSTAVEPIAEIVVDRNGAISIAGKPVARDALAAILGERMKRAAVGESPIVLVKTADALPAGESKEIRAIVQELGCKPVEK